VTRRNQNIYREEKAIKERARQCGLSVKDMAQWVNLAPSTLCGKLGGWTPLEPEIRAIIDHRLSEIETALKYGAVAE
jgi:hypothetical protein